jgi:hypothetical protein
MLIDWSVVVVERADANKLFVTNKFIKELARLETFVDFTGSLIV